MPKRLGKIVVISACGNIGKVACSQIINIAKHNLKPDETLELVVQHYKNGHNAKAEAFAKELATICLPQKGKPHIITRSSTDFSELTGADVVIVAAGIAAARGNANVRADLFASNKPIIGTIAAEINKRCPEALRLFIANPIDDITHFVYNESKNCPDIAEHLLGLGTAVDSLRFRAILSDRLNKQLGKQPDEGVSVFAHVIGYHHADGMIPVRSTITIDDIPIKEFIHSHKQIAKQLENHIHDTIQEVLEAGMNQVKKSGGISDNQSPGLLLAEASMAYLLPAGRENSLFTSAFSTIKNAVCTSLVVEISHKQLKQVEPELNNYEEARLARETLTFLANYSHITDTAAIDTSHIHSPHLSHSLSTNIVIRDNHHITDMMAADIANTAQYKDKKAVNISMLYDSQNSIETIMKSGWIGGIRDHQQTRQRLLERSSVEQHMHMAVASTATHNLDQAPISNFKIITSQWNDIPENQDYGIISIGHNDDPAHIVTAIQELKLKLHSHGTMVIVERDPGIPFWTPFYSGKQELKDELIHNRVISIVMNKDQQLCLGLPSGNINKPYLNDFHEILTRSHYDKAIVPPKTLIPTIIENAQLHTVSALYSLFMPTFSESITKHVVTAVATEINTIFNAAFPHIHDLNKPDEIYSQVKNNVISTLDSSIQTQQRLAFTLLDSLANIHRNATQSIQTPIPIPTIADIKNSLALYEIHKNKETLRKSFEQIANRSHIILPATQSYTRSASAIGIHEILPPASGIDRTTTTATDAVIDPNIIRDQLSALQKLQQQLALELKKTHDEFEKTRQHYMAAETATIPQIAALTKGAIAAIEHICTNYQIAFERLHQPLTDSANRLTVMEAQIAQLQRQHQHLSKLQQTAKKHTPPEIKRSLVDAINLTIGTPRPSPTHSNASFASPLPLSSSEPSSAVHSASSDETDLHPLSDASTLPEVDLLDETKKTTTPQHEIVLYDLAPHVMEQITNTLNDIINNDRNEGKIPLEMTIKKNVIHILCRDAVQKTLIAQQPQIKKVIQGPSFHTGR